MEGLLILSVGVLMFGGKKLPELGKGMGEAIKNFKVGMKEASEIKIEDKKDS